jgi:hypothetical protein
MTATTIDHWPLALVDVPAEWLSAELVSAYRERDHLTSGAEAVNNVVDVLRKRRDDAVGVVVAGGDDEAVGLLLRASADLLAAEAAQAAMPSPAVDQALIQSAVLNATKAFDEAVSRLNLASLDADNDIAAWRDYSLRNPGFGLVDPPTIVDKERELQPLAAAARADVDGLLTARRNWSESLRMIGVPADGLLRSAVGYVEMGRELAVRIGDLNTLIDMVNQERRDRGLTWTPRSNLP